MISAAPPVHFGNVVVVNKTPDREIDCSVHMAQEPWPTLAVKRYLLDQPAPNPAAPGPRSWVFIEPGASDGTRAVETAAIMKSNALGQSLQDFHIQVSDLLSGRLKLLREHIIRLLPGFTDIDRLSTSAGVSLRPYFTLYTPPPSKKKAAHKRRKEEGRYDFKPLKNDTPYTNAGVMGLVATNDFNNQYYVPYQIKKDLMQHLTIADQPTDLTTLFKTPSQHPTVVLLNNTLYQLNAAQRRSVLTDLKTSLPTGSLLQLGVNELLQQYKPAIVRDLTELGYQPITGENPIYQRLEVKDRLWLIPSTLNHNA